MYYELKVLHEFHLYWRQKMDEDVLGKAEDLTIMDNVMDLETKRTLEVDAHNYPISLN